MNVMDVLKYGNRTLLQSVEGLVGADWEVDGVCGVWSVKEIMAHLASHELLLVEILDTFLGADSGPYMQGYAEPGANFNDTQVERRRGMTVEEVLAEYHRAHRRVVEKAAQIPPETCRQVGTIPWYGPEYSLDDLVAYSNYGHKREHSAQINVYRDGLKG
jgi:hypothetical protein